MLHWLAIFGPKSNANEDHIECLVNFLSFRANNLILHLKIRNSKGYWFHFNFHWYDIHFKPNCSIHRLQHPQVVTLWNNILLLPFPLFLHAESSHLEYKQKFGVQTWKSPLTYNLVGEINQPISNKSENFKNSLTINILKRLYFPSNSHRTTLMRIKTLVIWSNQISDCYQMCLNPFANLDNAMHWNLIWLTKILIYSLINRVVWIKIFWFQLIPVFCWFFANSY